MYLIKQIPGKRMEVEYLTVSFVPFSTMEQFHLAVEAAETSEGKRKMDACCLYIVSKEPKNYKDARSFLESHCL